MQQSLRHVSRQASSSSAFLDLQQEDRADGGGPVVPMGGAAPAGSADSGGGFLSGATPKEPAAATAAVLANVTPAEGGRVQRSAAGEAVGNNSDPVSPVPGKVHFLFMAFTDLPNKDIWARFFAHARHGVDFEVLVHCKDESQCRDNFAAFREGHLFRTIPSVESKWCDNLVSPMDALLATALDLPVAPDGGARDKFAFISDSTVPLKPFGEVQRKLTIDDGLNSNFCVTPEDFWAWHRNAGGTRDVAVKHHQWLVLARAHAAKMVKRRAEERDIMENLTPLRWRGVTWLAPLLQDAIRLVTFGNMHGPDATGCLDEFLYFALLYGFVNRSGPVALNGFNGKLVVGSPANEDSSAASDFQGQCDTFDYFGGTGVKFKEMVDKLTEDEDTKMELSEPNLHPARFAELSTKGLRMLRASPYLFARKLDKKTRFKGNLSVAEAFGRYIFS